MHPPPIPVLQRVIGPSWPRRQRRPRPPCAPPQPLPPCARGWSSGWRERCVVAAVRLGEVGDKFFFYMFFVWLTCGFHIFLILSLLTRMPRQRNYYAYLQDLFYTVLNTWGIEISSTYRLDVKLGDAKWTWWKVRACSLWCQKKPYQILSLAKFWHSWQDFLYSYQNLAAN